jgi:hypothetical protein
MFGGVNCEAYNCVLTSTIKQKTQLLTFPEIRLIILVFVIKVDQHYGRKMSLVNIYNHRSGGHFFHLFQAMFYIILSDLFMKI